MAAALKIVSGDMDKAKALEAALAQIDRAFGKGSVMKLGSREAMEVEAISSGSLLSMSPGTAPAAAITSSTTQRRANVKRSARE